MRRVLLGVVAGCCLAGCQSVGPGGPPDPLVEEILKQPAPKKAPVPGTPDPLAAVVLAEVPLQTPVDQARAVMERHGFSCWSNVPDDRGVCLHCTAWVRRNNCYADRVVVKLYYESRRVVKVVATAEREVWHPF
jgi:hypothetical protein